MVGLMHSLTCAVTGAERLTDIVIAYQWSKNGVAVPDQTVMTLSFTPLTFSDAGRYACQATVSSSLFSVPIAHKSANSFRFNPICELSLSISNKIKFQSP